MRNQNSPLPEGWADDADLLICLTAAWESYGARQPLPVCIGGQAEPEAAVPAVEGAA